MSSSLTWLDYSERDRRRALDVIDLFREQDTRDELGIGTVRDAIADLLFPGTSTIQTRARYFLFIPWIDLDLERRSISSSRVDAEARRQEVALMKALATSADTDGVIGKEAREHLKRLPSSVYWQGLGRWGIRTFAGSRDQYHRWLDAFYSVRSSPTLRTDDGDPAEGSLRRNWHHGLPPRPRDFPQQASFQLGSEEAHYLQERIIARAPGTMLSFMVDRGPPFAPVDFPWEYPQQGELSARLHGLLHHARLFSLVIHGAALLYNLLLAEKRQSEERVEHYRGRLADWAQVTVAAGEPLARWDRRHFWETVLAQDARIPIPTRTFVDVWLDLATAAVADPTRAAALLAHPDARRLIHQRERALKRGQARLDNPRALELWNGAAGTAQLAYRWGVAQTLVLDILAGLERGGGHA